MPWNSDGTPREYKPKFTSKHSEELNETYYFADGIEIEQSEIWCPECEELNIYCECDKEVE